MTPTPDKVLAEHAAGVAAQAQTTALCLDFDGTLAPIVDDPNQARPLPGTVELLAQLAARFAAVALLSGRPADYLAQHAAAPGVRYLGQLHGFWRHPDVFDPAEPLLRQVAGFVQLVRDRRSGRA